MKLMRFVLHEKEKIDKKKEDDRNKLKKLIDDLKKLNKGNDDAADAIKILQASLKEDIDLDSRIQEAEWFIKSFE